MSDQEFVLVMFGMLSGVGLLLGIALGPVGRALGRRLEGRSAPNPEQVAMLEEVSARLEDLTQLRHEVAELQERMDFAERLLVERTPPERVRGGPE